MNKIILTIEKILSDNADKPIFYQRNLVKEYLQIFVLRFIYSQSQYEELVFYGGSCLFHFYNLPRLSEDLDFVDLKKKIKMGQLAQDLKHYFQKLGLPLKVKTQKFRIYLKFPLLHQLKLASSGESDWLFLKVEVFSGFDFCSQYKVEIKPLFKYNQTILAKVFDLPTLLATKIRAVLYRQWEKTDKNGRTIIQVKGRDFFDLMWYLEKKIEPNLACLGVKNKTELKRRLIEIVKKADARSIRLDLENFIADKNFVEKTSKNIKDILISYLSEW